MQVPARGIDLPTASVFIGVFPWTDGLSLPYRGFSIQGNHSEDKNVILHIPI